VRLDCWIRTMATRAAALVVLVVLAGLLPTGAEARLLVPMDLTQTDHLKAYGVAYFALAAGQSVEWLLNYRGGSFLLEDTPDNRRTALLRGVRMEETTGADEASVYAEIEQNNMDVMLLEKAPRVAVYVPPPTMDEPWDDAVILALTYAEIPFDQLYDPEVLSGKMAEYDWVHLHHEDFTGQYGKFYAAYRGAHWYRNCPGPARSRRPRGRLRPRMAAQARHNPAHQGVCGPGRVSLCDVLGQRHLRHRARGGGRRHRRHCVRRHTGPSERASAARLRPLPRLRELPARA